MTLLLIPKSTIVLNRSKKLY